MWIYNHALRKEQEAYGTLCLRTMAIIYYPREDCYMKVLGSQTPFEHFPKDFITRNIVIYIWLKYRAEPEQNPYDMPWMQVTWACSPLWWILSLMEVSIHSTHTTLCLKEKRVASLHFLCLTHNLEVVAAFSSWNFNFHMNWIFPALEAYRIKLTANGNN